VHAVVEEVRGLELGRGQVDGDDQPRGIRVTEACELHPHLVLAEPDALVGLAGIVTRRMRRQPGGVPIQGVEHAGGIGREADADDPDDARRRLGGQDAGDAVGAGRARVRDG